MENLTHIAYHEILLRIIYNEDRPYASPVISFTHITLTSTRPHMCSHSDCSLCIRKMTGTWMLDVSW